MERNEQQLVIGLIWMVAIVYYFYKNYSKIKAQRTLKKIFLKNIKGNILMNWDVVRKELEGFQGIEIQIGQRKPSEKYTELQSILMKSLTQNDKLEFEKNVIDANITPYQLVKIDNSLSFSTGPCVNYVIGLYAIPQEKMITYSNFLQKYLQEWDADFEKKDKRRNSKMIFTNFGICPKCMKKISTVARKCPYCTADLD